MSAIRALAWKEWREQQPVVVVAVLVAVAMPFVLIAGTTATGGRLDLPELSELMPGILAALVWPLFAAAAGGATIASELGEGTIGFLLSRPVPRARIWSVKIGIGAVSLLAILAGSLVVALVFGRVAHPGQGWFTTPETLSWDFPRQAIPAALTATALLFSASVFFSTFLTRAMNAAGAGLAAALGLIGALFVVWSRLDIMPRLEPGLFVLELLLAALAFLTGSLYLFCRGELLTGRGVKQRAFMVLGIAMALLAVITMPALWARTRLAPSEAVLAELSLNGAGDTLVATALKLNGMSPEVWMIPADGTGLTRPAGRLTFSPVFSPDEKRVAYLSMRGMLGLRSDTTEIRVMNADGGNDVRIAATMNNTWLAGGSTGMTFSPDGSRVALTDGGTLIIAPVNGEATSRFDLRKTPAAGGRLVGWARNGTEALLLASTWKPVTTSTLAAVGTSDGAIRVLHHQDHGRILLPMGLRPFRSWKRMPVMIDPDSREPGGFDLVMIDFEDGSLTPITHGLCAGAVDLSADDTVLAYATCPSVRTADMTSSLHILDTTTMLDREAGQVAGKAWRILISPTNDHFMIHRLRPAGGTLPTVIVNTDGSTRELEPGWIPVGWQGRERVVLSDEWEARRLSVADAATGALRVFYPTAR